MPIDRKNLPPPLTGFTPAPAAARPSAEDAPTQPAVHAVRVPIGSEPVPPWAAYLVERVDEFGTKIDSLFEDKKSTNQRVTRLEERFDRFEEKFEERSKKHSDGIRKGSDTDAKHDGAIATIVTDVAELKTAVAENTAATMAMKKVIVDDVKGFFKENPEVVRSIVTFLVTFMGFVSAYFAAKGH